MLDPIYFLLFVRNKVYFMKRSARVDLFIVFKCGCHGNTKMATSSDYCFANDVIRRRSQKPRGGSLTSLKSTLRLKRDLFIDDSFLIVAI